MKKKILSRRIQMPVAEIKVSYGCDASGNLQGLPSITFQLRSTDLDENLLQLHQMGLLYLYPKGITYGGKFKCTGEHKVIKAIQIYLKNLKNIATHTSDQSLVVDIGKVENELNHFVKLYKNRYPHKFYQNVSVMSKSFSKFENENSSKKLPESVNVTRIVRKKKNPQKKYIQKTYINGAVVSEFEVFNGFCYRLLLGNRHPKVRGLYDENNERIGLISSQFKQFKSFHDYQMGLGKGKSLDQKMLLDAEVVKVWVAAYVEEENDLHGGNYGIGPDGYCVKIDDDQSTSSLTWKYTFPFSNHSYPASKDDIKTFPKLDVANPEPRNWPDRSDNHFIKFDQLVREKKFQEDKYYMFLKRILVPNEVYEAIGLATISSGKKRKKFVDNKCDKTKKLRAELMGMSEFHEYVLNHPEAINQIISEFSEYNNVDAKKHEYLRINLSDVSQNYFGIQQEVSRIMNQASDLGSYLVDFSSLPDLTIISDLKKAIKDEDPKEIKDYFDSKKINFDHIVNAFSEINGMIEVMRKIQSELKRIWEKQNLGKAFATDNNIPLMVEFLSRYDVNLLNNFNNKLMQVMDFVSSDSASDQYIMTCFAAAIAAINQKLEKPSEDEQRQLKEIIDELLTANNINFKVKPLSDLSTRVIADSGKYLVLCQEYSQLNLQKIALLQNEIAQLKIKYIQYVESLKSQIGEIRMRKSRELIDLGYFDEREGVEGPMKSTEEIKNIIDASPEVEKINAKLAKVSDLIAILDDNTKSLSQRIVDVKKKESVDFPKNLLFGGASISLFKRADKKSIKPSSVAPKNIVNGFF